MGVPMFNIFSLTTYQSCKAIRRRNRYVHGRIYFTDWKPLTMLKSHKVKRGIRTVRDFIFRR